MIFRKTVRKALEETGWDNLIDRDQDLKNFMEKYGELKCRFPLITLNMSLTYYKLHKKSREFDIRIFQEGQSLYLHEMDPFEGALCLCIRGSVAEVFRYYARPFAETVVIQDIDLLRHQFENFNIVRIDGSRVEKLHDLPDFEELLAISKKTFDIGCGHIIIRYMPYGIY